MGLRKGKGKTLRTTFIKYIFYLGILIGILMLANYLIFARASIGVYPANYSERIIKNNFHELKSSSKVTMDLLTPMCSFGVYSDDGDFLYGNFPPKYIKEGWDSYSQGKNIIGSLGYLASIEREEGVLIISYPLRMQFVNEDLRKILPNAELTITSLFFLQLFIVIILWANRLAKEINNELKSLLNAVEKIEEQDLDFKVGTSNIEDIDVVLQGIDIMKNSLRSALEKQWFLEQQKKEQISALAHDVKTPLTIVKGNVGLLKETNMTEEQKNYCNYIETSSEQIEEYLQKLLLITKEEMDKEESNQIIYIKRLVNSLKIQGEALGKTKDITIIYNIDIEEEIYLKANEFELERALMNIIRNAVDFSPNSSTMTMNALIDNSHLLIQIIDQGKGFSEKILRYGKEQFFMEDESRTKDGHHGLGLYIANNIITKYRGELILSNDGNSGGSVKVKIPLYISNI